MCEDSAVLGQLLRHRGEQPRGAEGALLGQSRRTTACAHKGLALGGVYRKHVVGELVDDGAVGGRRRGGGGGLFNGQGERTRTRRAGGRRVISRRELCRAALVWNGGGGEGGRVRHVDERHVEFEAGRRGTRLDWFDSGVVSRR